jgi:hypothetical protein
MNIYAELGLAVSRFKVTVQKVHRFTELFYVLKSCSGYLYTIVKLLAYLSYCLHIDLA